jgi:hypothetical protein
MRKLTFVLSIVAAVGANAQLSLYGVGRIGLPGQGRYHFSVINTTTGAATGLFIFSVPGTTHIESLTYVPSTNRFLSIATVNPSQTLLVEIDHGAQTATTVAHGIPNAYFSGLEYMASLGGVVVSHGPGGFMTGSIALLNPATYGLMATGAIPGAPDSDIIFMDGTGALNYLDANQPNANGFQRNIINNPFGVMSVTGYGANPFIAARDWDLAWKGDESRLFLTQDTWLSTVGAGNVITTVGPYGVTAGGTPIEITGLAVPEPGALIVLGAGALALLRRRRK